MAWIESHQSLGHHPKTLRLAHELRCSVPCAIGYLHLLWWWALDYAQDGVVSGDKQAVIARACMWSKKPEQFWAGLLSAGFIEHTEQGLRIHDWMDYAGRLVQQRAANAERMRTARAKHVRHTSGTRAEHVQGLPTGPDRTQPLVSQSVGISPARARARADQAMTPLSSALDAALPEEVRRRLAQPPIQAPADQPTDRPTN
jgi:hypothetical protein